MTRFLPEPQTALEMARNLAHAVDGYAQAADDDPTRAHALAIGTRQQRAAEMAGQMALVSIAEDLHRIADHLAGHGRPAPAAADNPRE